MEKSLLTEVKAILKSLVISCPERITVEQLNRDYRDTEGQFIPFRQLGYGSVEEFLHSIPDALRVFGSGPTAMVGVVANEKSDHIHNMVMKQKKAKTRPRQVSNKRNAFQRSNNINNHQPSSIVGQQLSPYQSVNRNYMTKRAQVCNLPLAGTANIGAGLLPNPTLYYLPQPNDILLHMQQSNYTQNSVLSLIKNGSIKAVDNRNRKYEKEVNQINTLLRTKCNVSNPTPSIACEQNRIVKFSSQKKSAELEQDNKKKSVFEKSTETQISEESIKETNFSFNKIKGPKVKKQIAIKFTDEVENMRTVAKISNEEHSSILVSEQLNKEKDQIVKSVNKTKTPQHNCFFHDSADAFEDPDEAIPSFAAKNNVFRLDFPECTVPYGSKIAPYKLSDEITVGSCIKIFVSEIHNPFKFWFHIYKDDHDLDLLMHQIERYYSTLDSENLRIPVSCLIPGQICAACYNGLWHRAEIVALPIKTSIKVSFMDYGTVCEVDIENVKLLESFFAQLPAQAVRGCLSHIQPRELHWSHTATMYFLTLVSELLLYAKITEINREENILYMILCDTNGDEVVQINTALIEKRYAYFNEDWKTERIKQNNGKRIRHPIEDFPTFSMIESGEYPSFSELVSLQQHGIDYESIYDPIIYNQSSILNKHESVSERFRSLPYFLMTSNPFRSEILLELYDKTSKAL